MLKNKLHYDVIFPFYKDYKYLDKSIKSLNLQKLLPINLIFIDDEGIDKTLKKNLLSKLNKKIHLKFIRHSKNRGTIASLNTGFKYIESEYFFIMSADDIYYKNLALKSLELIDQYPQASFVVSNPIMNFTDLNKKRMISYNFLKKKFYNETESKILLKKFSVKFYHNTVFYRSSIFLKKNLFKEDLGPRNDFYNLVFLSSLNGFCYLNENLGEFTIRKNQTNKYHSDNFLFNEIKYIKKEYPFLYQLCKDTNLFFDISPIGLIFIDSEIKNLRSLSLFKKSILFYFWKKFRIFVPSNILNKIYNYLNN